jgi:hypothetical protein
MTALLWLLAAIGAAPLAAGAWGLPPPSSRASPLPPLGAVLLCALAFNLTFSWQELSLVVPKALTPGLHPVLFHNDHAWTGHAPTVELLAGAVLAMALAGAWLARACPGGRPTRDFAWRSLLTALAAVVVIVPVRLPRDLVEVAFIPLFVNLVGAGWLVFGARFVTRSDDPDAAAPGIVGPALALAVTLLVFQLVLRPGVAF